MIRAFIAFAVLMSAASATAGDYILRFDMVSIDYGRAADLKFDPDRVVVRRCEAFVGPVEDFAAATSDEVANFDGSGSTAHWDNGRLGLRLKYSFADARGGCGGTSSFWLHKGESLACSWSGGGWDPFTCDMLVVSLDTVPASDAERDAQWQRIAEYQCQELRRYLDEKLAADALRDRTASALLAQAKVLREGDPAVARNLLWIVVRQYGQAPQAKEAQSLLEGLPR